MSSASAEVKAQFDEIANRFGWEPVVKDWIISDTGLAARSIDDFLFAASKAEDLEAIANQARAVNKLLATSRLRQAWTRLREDKADQDTIRKKGLLEVDLDEMIPRPELDNLNVMHYTRYKLTWPPERAPADTLVSRYSKEVDKRLLCLGDMWKVRTQSHQQRAKRKKQRVAEDVELLIGDPEDEDNQTQDLVLYLAGLETAMIALSIAGIKPASATPPPDIRGVDTVLIVQVPLDITMRYFYRAQQKVARMPPSEGLRWLQRKDEDERSIWVDRYRNGTKTLGAIILETMNQREAMWEAERVPKPIAPPKEPIPDKEPQETKRNSKTQRVKKKLGKPKTVAKVFRDGTKLCQAYQRGQCANSQCKMRHSCGAVTKSGRVCGGQHPASQCRNKAVVRTTS